MNFCVQISFKPLLLCQSWIFIFLRRKFMDISIQPVFNLLLNWIPMMQHHTSRYADPSLGNGTICWLDGSYCSLYCDLSLIYQFYRSVWPKIIMGVQPQWRSLIFFTSTKSKRNEVFFLLYIKITKKQLLKNQPPVQPRLRCDQITIANHSKQSYEISPWVPLIAIRDWSDLKIYVLHLIILEGPPYRIALYV